MTRKALLAFGLLFVSGAVKAEQSDWKDRIGAGGFVKVSNFAVGGQNIQAFNEGATVSYGVDRRIRVGGDFGVWVSHTDSSAGGDVSGFSIAPWGAFDLISKSGGSFYAVARPLAFDDIHSNKGGTFSNFDILNAGVGIEIMPTRDFGWSMEGDVLRVGSLDAGGSSHTQYGLLAFPAIRMAMKMYF